MPDVRPPVMIEDLPVRGDGRGSQITSGQSRLVVSKEGVKHLSTGSRTKGNANLLEMLIVGKLVGEAECTRCDPRLDPG
jgi:hypothetical protein